MIDFDSSVRMNLNFSVRRMRRKTLPHFSKDTNFGFSKVNWVFSKICMICVKIEAFVILLGFAAYWPSAEFQTF